MRFKLWLYEQWVRLSDWVNKQLAPVYVEYMNAIAVAKAEKFLAKFRSTQWYHDRKIKQQKAKPGPNQSCKHLKGGSRTYGAAYKDYAVASHRFPNNRTKIWCLLNCGFTSWEGDANWLKATSMLESSSNKGSASETVFFGRKSEQPTKAVYMDKI